MPNTHRASSETFFLSQKATVEALRKLADSETIVIYCGAGVSLDRTAVGWNQLIRSIFQLANMTYVGDKRIAKSVEYLLEYFDNNTQLASIVVQQFAGASESDNEFLASKLKEILYVNNGWNAGQILRNVVQTALVAGSLGKKVVIVTTNYDQYIEDEFIARRASLIDAGATDDELPGMKRRVLRGAKGAKSEIVTPNGSLAEEVEIIYLHGRVDKNAAVEGEIVLTEHSYAKSRERSSRILFETFQGRAVLVAGASLTDEPLIFALASSRTSSGDRYALISTSPDLLEIDRPFPGQDVGPKITDKNVREALQLRGKHLGINVLSPMNHQQTAQFLEELRLALLVGAVTGDTDHYGKPGNVVDYPSRLTEWNRAWKARSLTMDPQGVFETLQIALQAIMDDILTPKSDRKEGLRLELWVRANPRSTDRTLTLWANSVGPVLDRTIMRTEPLTTTNKNASVRALLAGKPQLVSLDDLGYADGASRWKTFLSVPIMLQVPVTVAGSAQGANIPVGVVTLTSDHEIRESVEDDFVSVFRDNLSIAEMVEIKEILIGLGRDVLGMQDSPATPTV